MWCCWIFPAANGRMRAGVMVLAALASVSQAASLPETAIFSAFKQVDASLLHFVQLQRTSVTEELDLIVAMGSVTKFPTEFPGIFWSADRRIGLFLQEKERPERVYLLDTKSGFQDCAARIERVTATDTVISCTGEKSYRFPNQKWVYDVRAKSLIRQFSYPPFASHLLPRAATAAKANGAVFLGGEPDRTIAVDYSPDQLPLFRVLSGAETKIWTRRASRAISTTPPMPALPKTTYDQFAAARPLRVKDGYVRQGTELTDAIGPWKRQDEKIWFGKSFYDSEGSTGVGGFGYFDEKDKKLNLFAPPEVIDWSVSALEVTPEAVWMALVHNGEYGGSSGGLLFYDRQIRDAHRIPLPDIVISLLQVNGKILAATDFGFTVVEGDRVLRYFVDQTTDGRWRVVPAIW